jgi:hypothetical protein
MSERLLESLLQVLYVSVLFLAESIQNGTYISVLFSLFLASFTFVVISIGFSSFRGHAFGSDTALQAGRSRVRFQMESLVFFIDLILPAAL